MIATFQDRKELFAAQAGRRAVAFSRVSWLRLAVFAAALAGGWLCWRAAPAWAAAGVWAAGLALFVAVLQWHRRIGEQCRHLQFLSQLNHEEEQRLQNAHRPENTGLDFADAQHPYTGDLDIFGPHSLFVLLNRTQTAPGAEMLARWLQTAAPAPDRTARQQAVQEMSGHPDWMQDFQATGRRHADDPAHARRIRAWLQTPAVLHRRTALLAAAYALPLLMLAALVAAGTAAWATYHLPVAVGLLNLGVVGLVNKHIRHLTEQAYETGKPLRLYADLLQWAESHPFASARLQEIKGRLVSDGRRPSVQIDRLAGIAGNLLAAHNPFFGLLANGLVLWNLQWAIRLERWKARTHTDLPRWLDALAELEALNSLAGYRHANPSYPFADLADGPALRFEAEAVAHPLLPAGRRTANDFGLDGTGRTAIVTGSNMSGKSTFLRTVGINAVLALAGAPVCAARLRLSAFQVFTSMRTQDSLEESVSSFYAELKRLKQLIDRLPTGEPVFYLLDEILKGTNSQDRHEGAKALIRQLHRHAASGLISTHDLALSEMAAELPDAVANYSFNSEIVDERLVFDYRLQPGVCRSFNASKLMRQIGIEME